MPTINIKDIPESKMVKLVDLSEDSINKIAEAVVRKIAADAVEVVRCKDCRYYHIYWESNGHTEKEYYGACDWINDNSVREDHFCSWGEKREDDKID